MDINNACVLYAGGTIAVYYLLINLYTFFVYARDKKAAEGGEWRTPEWKLHLLRLTQFHNLIGLKLKVEKRIFGRKLRNFGENIRRNK